MFSCHIINKYFSILSASNYEFTINVGILDFLRTYLLPGHVNFNIKYFD